MSKTNIRQVPKGLRLRWAPLREAASVRLSSDAIRGTRSSENGRFLTMDLETSRFVERTAVGNRNSSNSKFLIP